MFKRLVICWILLLPVVALAQEPNDCSRALTVCGNVNLSFNSSGWGTDDFAAAGNPPPGCFNPNSLGLFENQSLWLRVSIQTSGTLGFTITPNDTRDDYDFAIFGPDVDCNSLGAAIRCSWANTIISTSTGLNNTALDNSEGPTGDGFVRELDVLAGETYTILIDNFSNSNRGFQLTWSGTALIADAPTLNTIPDQSICDTDNNNIEDFDLSTLDNIASGGAAGVQVSYHNTEPDAILGNNPLPTIHSVVDGQQVFVRLTSAVNNCASVGNFRFNLNARPEGLSIMGSAFVCPNANNIQYSIAGDNGYTYQWTASGGTVVSGGNGTQVGVDWHGANPGAYLEVVATDNLGCTSLPIRLNVVVNFQLQPPVPQGPLLLCRSNNIEATYSVLASNGSTYTWTVENGTQIAGGNSNSITVRWAGTTPGRIWFVESNPAVTMCAGTSPIQTVNFFPELFTAVSSSNVNCFGNNNGSIDVNITGGLAPYTISWDDGNASTSRSGLGPGDYTYTATDANNCQIIEIITITEPQQLIINDIATTNLRCYRDRSGVAQATVSGGTLPYTYDWRLNGNSVSNSPGTLNGATAGANYELVITDANNCTTSSSFVLTEPDALEYDLNQLINNPICPQATDGEVTVGATGGTPDYTFEWVLTPVQNGPTATGLPRGTYTVLISDANGCTTSQTVEVQERFPRIIIPTAFSPNGDQVNDVFSPIAICGFDEFRIVVYNRWGNPVYSSSDLEAGWDGTYEGTQLSPNQYTYFVSYRFTVNGRTFSESIRGTVSIVR